MTRIIALTGAAGSGKSTAAEILEERGFVRIKFAEPLKKMLAALYSTVGLSPDDIYERIEGEMKERVDPHLLMRTPRLAMQTLGTEWGRDCIGEDLWTDLWSFRVDRARERGFSVVVDDCRFPNEAATVRGLGGTIIKMVGRGGIPGTHASEQGIDGDITFDNTGSRGALRSFLTFTLNEMGIA